MSERVYRRGQVEWALWELFRQQRPAPPQIPSAFRTRIKKLLDIDRIGDMEGAQPDAAPTSFSDDPPTGTGSDAPYTAFDCACLAYALDMLDAGFKQSEVVFLLRHIRRRLRREYDHIIEANSMPVRARRRPEDAPHLPTYKDERGKWVDDKVFVLIQKIEVGEVFAVPVPAIASRKAPLFTDPRMCRGVEALAREMQKMSISQRKVFVLEIAWSSSYLTLILPRAPSIARGRKA